jgi:hypothetical protein
MFSPRSKRSRFTPKQNSWQQNYSFVRPDLYRSVGRVITRLEYSRIWRHTVWYLSTKLLCVTSQKAVIWLLSATEHHHEMTIVRGLHDISMISFPVSFIANRISVGVGLLQRSRYADQATGWTTEELGFSSQGQESLLAVGPTQPPIPPFPRRSKAGAAWSEPFAFIQCRVYTVKYTSTPLYVFTTCCLIKHSLRRFF